MALPSAARNLIITIGQSLNSAPDASGPISLYGQIRDHYAGRARVEKGHIPGIAWLQWKRTQDWFTYFNYWADNAGRVIFAMCGGTTDYSTTANRTGPQCYADQVTISTNLRAYGSQVKIIGSTTNPSTDLTGTNETNRQAGNTLVMADASAAFDQKVNYAATTNLTDPANTTYYSDGTHPTALGQTLMFAAVQPAIDALLL